MIFLLLSDTLIFNSSIILTKNENNFVLQITGKKFFHFSRINLLKIPLTKTAFLSPAWRTRVSPAENVISTRYDSTHHTFTLGGQDPHVCDVRHQSIHLPLLLPLLSIRPNVGGCDPIPHDPIPNPLVSLLS